MDKISFATVCMNRLHHLRLTLPKNIEDNLHDGNIEFIVLDYNSKDGLEEWIREEMKEYIEAGVLSYYKTLTPEFFNRSHSRNMMFRLASGDIICNVDADNYTGEGFAGYIRGKFSSKENIFLNADTSGRLYQARGAFGRFASYKNDFMEIGGYDENMVCYGFEDTDLTNRLVRLGRKEEVIEFSKYVNYIHHGNEERFKNEFTFLHLDSLFINYIDPALTDFLFLYKNGEFDNGLMEDSFNSTSSSYTNQLNPPSEYFQFNIKQGSWDKGSWEKEDDVLQLNYADGKENAFRSANFNAIVDGSSRTFYKVTNKKMLEEAVFAHSQITNRTKMKANTKNNKATVNEDGFGKGEVFKNFDYTLPIQLT